METPRLEVDYALLKRALKEALDEEQASFAEIAPKFANGTLLIKPKDAALQAKEIPLKEFFKKVVRLRDQLRTLEQKINSQEALSAEDKAIMQGYVTRCYGSLTTFNILFRDDGDRFVGQKGKD
ncbi:hypothetical protein HY251_20980 [bacterium]|nr:hypothetical protein [bacterium]